jgi:hypothetical protein
VAKFSGPTFWEKSYTVYSLIVSARSQALSLTRRSSIGSEGLTDGNDGAYPELCVEFPYLQHNESVDALTMDYCVDNQDGTRTRLLRTDMRTALTELLERIDDDGTGLECRLAKVMAAELRALAQQVESATIEDRAPLEHRDAEFG